MDNRRTSTRIQMIADYEGDPKTLIEDQEEGLYPTL